MKAGNFGISIRKQPVQQPSAANNNHPTNANPASQQVEQTYEDYIFNEKI